MTARQLISSLQELGDNNLDKEIIMFDGPSYYTPYKAEIMQGKDWGKMLQGKILID